MAKKTNSDIILEGSNASWQLNAKGNVHGNYTGSFKFKCYLSPTEKIAANREYRELLGGNPAMPAPEHETFLAYALTQLKYRIVTSPPFWSTTLQNSLYEGDLADENVIVMVLDAAIRAESKYKEQFEKRKKTAVKRAKQTAEIIKKEQEVAEEEDSEEENEENRD